MKVSKTQVAENRTAILQAAARLYRERGFTGVGVADITREAGLTHGGLYRHFESKDARRPRPRNTRSSGNSPSWRRRMPMQTPTPTDSFEPASRITCRHSIATASGKAARWPRSRQTRHAKRARSQTLSPKASGAT